MTILGLAGWLISGIAHVVALYIRKSHKAPKWWNDAAKYCLFQWRCSS